MDRLIATNSVPFANADTAPATGTPQYATSGNPGTNTPATVYPAYAFNAMQDEVMNVILAAGLTPNRNAWNQLLTAIQTLLQQGVSNVGVDTGAANAYVVAFSPALTAPVPWAPFWFEVKTTNTGASTLNATGTVEPLVGGAHLALQGGELVAKGNALVYWNPTLASGAGSYVLLFCSGAPEQVAPATASQHAMQLGQATGRLLRTSVYAVIGGVLQVSVNGATFTTTGASTFTSLAATNLIDAEVLGGGGGGGGSGAQGSTTWGLGAGGASGSYARGIFTTGFSGGIAVTAGAPGAAAVAGAGSGGNGGTSSLGALMTAPGGGGGPTNGSLVQSSATASNGAPGAVATGGTITNMRGVISQLGYVLTNAVFSGGGASSIYGAGGPPAGVNSAGIAATGFGSGGSGGATGNSGAAQAGAAGTSGLIIVREYA